MHVGTAPASRGIPVGQLRMLDIPYHKTRIEASADVVPEPFKVITIKFDKICQLGRVQHRLQGLFKQFDELMNVVTSSGISHNTRCREKSEFTGTFSRVGNAYICQVTDLKPNPKPPTQCRWSQELITS